MKAWIDRVIGLAVKEYKEYARSTLLLFLAFASPLIMFFLFSYGFTLDVTDIPYSVLDQDQSSLSRDLLDRLAVNPSFELQNECRSEDELNDEMTNDRIRFAIIIPPDFSRTLHGGKSVAVQVLINGTMANRAIVTKGYVEAFIADYNSRKLASSDLMGKISFPVDILPEARFNPSLESTNVLVPGIAGLVLLIFPAVLAAISLSRERESGMILNFYTSPLSRFQFLLGKGLPLLTIGILNYLLFFVLTIWLFHVPFGGDFATLMLAMVLYMITTIGIGFLVATLVRSEVASLLIASIVTFLPGFLYSGLMMPVQSMGAEGKMMASILPAYYFIRVAKAVFLKRMGFFDLLGEIGALVAIAVVLFGLAILRLKKKMA